MQRRKLRLIEQATKQKIEEMFAPSIKDINAKRIERFKQTISSTLETADVSMFEKMIEEHAEAAGLSTTKIAAALALMAQNGREFLISEKKKERRYEEERTTTDAKVITLMNDVEERVKNEMIVVRTGRRRGWNDSESKLAIVTGFDQETLLER